MKEKGKRQQKGRVIFSLAKKNISNKRRGGKRKEKKKEGRGALCTSLLLPKSKKGNISLHPNAIADGNAQKVCVRTTITKKEKKRKIRPPLLHLVSCPL
jgi:hypothetical protein